jgi:hypothetical protein
MNRFFPSRKEHLETFPLLRIRYGINWMKDNKIATPSPHKDDPPL